MLKKGDQVQKKFLSIVKIKGLKSDESGNSPVTYPQVKNMLNNTKISLHQDV